MSNVAVTNVCVNIIKLSVAVNVNTFALSVAVATVYVNMLTLGVANATC